MSKIKSKIKLTTFLFLAILASSAPTMQAMDIEAGKTKITEFVTKAQQLQLNNNLKARKDYFNELITYLSGPINNSGCPGFGEQVKKQTLQKIDETAFAISTFALENISTILGKLEECLNETAHSAAAPPQSAANVRQPYRSSLYYATEPTSWQPESPIIISSSSTGASAAAAAAQPSGSKAQQTPATYFSIITNNVLADRDYRNIGKNSPLLMPLKDRQELFNNAFAEKFKVADIICLQEVEELTIPKNNFTIVGPRYTELYTLINPQRFKFINANDQKFKTNGATNRGFLVTILQTIDGKNTIGVINTHLQGGPGPLKKYEEFRIDQMQEIIRYIDAQKPQYPNIGWIICGDFNTDAKNPAYKSLRNTVLIPNNFADTQDYVAIKGQPSSLTAQGTKETMDYIEYDKNKFTIRGSAYLSEEKELLTHGRENDSQKRFYSDHRILFVLFEIIQ